MNRIKEGLLRSRGILVTDFDGTLTLSGSSLHGAVHVLGKASGLAAGRDRLFQKMGREILEAAGDLQRKEEEKKELYKKAEVWWQKQMELYVREKISEEILKKTAELLPPRREALELLEFCRRESLPVWIVSAGLGNVIRFWLEAQGITENGVRVLANELYYRGKNPAGYGEIVTIWNKKDKFFAAAAPEEERKLFFLGDKKEDLRWRKNNEESYGIQGGEIVKIEEPA